MGDVRVVGRESAGAVGAVLGSAFERDPVFTWMTPASHRRERLVRFFTSAATVSSGDGTEVHLSDDGLGAAVWRAPDRWKVPTGELARLVPTMVRVFGRRLPRVLGGLSTIEKVHPHEPHWYLEFLGTTQEAQRKGVGTRVISTMLERCDQEGIPAYLEASSPENVPFYRRHGFEVRQEIGLKGGPPVWAMWRDPR